MALREAICAWHKRELNPLRRDALSASAGNFIFNVSSVLVHAGDERLSPRLTGKFSGHYQVSTCAT